MKAAWSMLGLATLLTLTAGCPEKKQAGTTTSKPADTPAGPRVELTIGRGNEDWGKIVLELNETKAPVTVRNFTRYVQEGYFDGTIFHRVIPGFMIQGGGFTAPGQEKREGLHDPIRNESLNGLQNVRGTISMARTNDPHSATSQFFISVADNRQNLDPKPPQYGYAVFGKVVEGMDLVDRIVNVQTKNNPAMGENSQPVDPPVLRKARMVK